MGGRASYILLIMMLMASACAASGSSGSTEPSLAIAPYAPALRDAASEYSVLDDAIDRRSGAFHLWFSVEPSAATRANILAAAGVPSHLQDHVHLAAASREWHLAATAQPEAWRFGPELEARGYQVWMSGFDPLANALVVTVEPGSAIAELDETVRTLFELPSDFPVRIVKERPRLSNLPS